ncbi:hypothetical protein LWI28_027606 [Acer negundo]|uniref:Reverse transcriptase domain-containing protein n=1 Tax=Acer negundo TaxID=4023 RepID=A0AAD5J8B8_ACENE|nr:hypothetical protein LWI28_027606 [Acer negundo]
MALPRICFDHCPLLVRLSDFEVSSHRSLRFQSMWLEHPDFIAIVCRIWSSLVVGSLHQVVIYKLRNLKKALKSWNYEVFGDLNSAIAGKSAELHFLQLDLSNRGFSNDLFMAEASVHSELDVLLCRHECFYRDRSRVRWLRDGDRNTSFFHASIKRRQYRNTISALSINGVLSEDRPTIRDHIISYYSSLFSLDVSRVGRDLSIVDDVILSLVTAAENAFLTSVPSTDDIHDAVFAMDATSAPGPDEFSGSFYQRCWDVLHCSSSELRDSISVDQFRPIVLSNFLFKISSKILADRLARVAARIISPQQFGFIRDQHIEDCIALASNCVNMLQKKFYGGNLAIKIDIRKAFDILDWSFLCRVLQAFRFSSVFMDWIDVILRSSRLSVLFNRVPKGYFCCSRRVRQGDPLSLLLFGIAEDFLSRLLTRGTQKNLKHIMGAFRDYSDISGQLVNWGKSSIYFESSISTSRIGSLQSLVGMQIGQLPFSYLGVPLFHRKPRKAVLRPIADKILSKFAKWKGKSLSLAGRATLIRPYSHGGFGLKDLRLLNDSLLRKFTWKFIIFDGFAFSFLLERYLRHLQKPYGGYVTSSIWSSLRTNYSSLLKEGIPDYLANPFWERVSDFIHEGRWVLDDSFRAHLPDLCFRIDRIAISPNVDSLVWANSWDGHVSYKIAYSQFLRDIPQAGWWRDVWSRFIPPSRLALTWRLMLNRLPTEDRLCRSGF